MLGAGWIEAVAFAAAFVISAIATPAGVSRAVLHRRRHQTGGRLALLAIAAQFLKSGLS